MGIDPTYYEAAMVDGASKWQQIKHVTIPQLIPLMTILTILAVGNIFRADFGLFYNIPRNSGALYDVTQVLDTYIYNGLTSRRFWYDGCCRTLPISCRLCLIDDHKYDRPTF